MKPNAFLWVVLALTVVLVTVAFGIIPFSARPFSPQLRTAGLTSPLASPGQDSPKLTIALSTKFLPSYTPPVTLGLVEDIKAKLKLLQVLYFDTFSEWLARDAQLPNEIRFGEASKLVSDLEAGSVHLAVLQGFEYRALPQKTKDVLKPLAILVEDRPPADVNPAAFLLINKSKGVVGFAGLQGTKTKPTILGVVEGGNTTYTDVFLRRLLDKVEKGISREKFFSSVVRADNYEVALDDLVDNQTDAVLVTGRSYASFARQKPGRAKKLAILDREIFPPVVLVAKDGALDQGALAALEKTLIGDCALPSQDLSPLDSSSPEESRNYTSNLGRSTMLFWKHWCFRPSALSSLL